MKVGAIVTTPPYADFLEEVAAHPLVEGLRLNTVMPLREEPGVILDRLGRLGPPLWVDLKGRQLRVAEAGIPPFTEGYLELLKLFVPDDFEVHPFSRFQVVEYPFHVIHVVDGSAVHFDNHVARTQSGMVRRAVLKDLADQHADVSRYRKGFTKTFSQ